MHSLLLIDPVLASDVDTFEAGIEVLKTTDGKEHWQTAKTLCELARDIRLRMGPPSDLPQDLVNRITSLFRQAAHLVNTSSRDDLRVFALHIEMRADMIEGKA
jgi:hypothetical protein